MAVEDGSASEAALTELRTRLEHGLAEQGVTKTALARRAGLGRTAVSQAFNWSAPAPSARTVGALAQALRLDVEALLELRASAAGVQHVVPADGVTLPSPGIGQPIINFDPHELEVHPAIDVAPGPAAAAGTRSRRLPCYVRRLHDQELDELVKAATEGHSGIAVLVGPSSTGKTRACWEAIQALAPLGWRLWHPFDPTRAEAALNDLQRVGPRTVVWLNEAQHYLGASRGLGERIAAALRTLLADRGVSPVLVLGTLWNNYATEYMALPAPGRPDPYPQTRELLAGRLITLPDSFDVLAIKDARMKASGGDLQLAQALKHARDGRLTQYLAGAPALLERYKMAPPPVRALIQVAMDVCRFGIGNRVNADFLAQAVTDYLTDHDYLTLGGDWLTKAFIDASKPVHGDLAPLTPVPFRGPPCLGQPHHVVENSSGGYKLADSLEQFGRFERHLYCPPTSFWEAAREHLTDSTELVKLADAAHDRYRLYWASILTDLAADQGDVSILVELADMWGEGVTEKSKLLYLRAAELGSPRAMGSLAFLCDEAGDREEAGEWRRKASAAGDGSSTLELAEMRARMGDLESAEHLYRQAVALGEAEALGPLGSLIADMGGDADEALHMLKRSICTLVRQTASAEIASLDRVTGTRQPTLHPWQSRREAGILVRRIEDRGDEGDYEGFLEAVTEASSNGDTYGLFCLCLFLRMKDESQADPTLESAARDGNPYALLHFARGLEKRGELEEAEACYRALIDSGDVRSAALLANLMKSVGSVEEAEELYWRAIGQGNTYAMYKLSELKEEIGDQSGAEEIARQAADAGDSAAARMLSEARSRFKGYLWPYGLNPDGTPTSDPWW